MCGVDEAFLSECLPDAQMVPSPNLEAFKLIFTIKVTLRELLTERLAQAAVVEPGPARRNGSGAAVPDGRSNQSGSGVYTPSSYDV
jgi:hypothetical protein